MLPLEQFSQMVNEHLGIQNNRDGDLHINKWTIGESEMGGRGLIATQDIPRGDVLFVDHPLLKGPRSGTIVPRGCTVCCTLESNTFFKCSKCALLLCSKQCEISEVHDKDCAVITRWNNLVPIEEVDDKLLSRSLTAIRLLLLDEHQIEFISCLQANDQPQHGSEIIELKKYFILPEQDERLLTLACHVLDANAFQIATPYGKKEMSLRGLYPVASLMNHCCVPNTRYSYNSDNQMIVRAVKDIRAGSEIFTCYSGLLWGTPVRRTYLYKTKHFLCKCNRCIDPTESGTLLAALKCFSSECPGSLLPIEPLKVSSPWRCLQCAMIVPSKNIVAVQNALGSLMNTLDFGNINELESFLSSRIQKYVPRTNQIVVDLQCRLIWEIGEADGFRWHEVSEKRLKLKESLCRRVLGILTALDMGEAHFRGLILYHLHAAMAERARRSPLLYEELKSEIESTIEQAYNILHGDISSPPDIELRYRYLGPGCDRPQEERFFILDS